MLIYNSLHQCSGWWFIINISTINRIKTYSKDNILCSFQHSPLYALQEIYFQSFYSVFRVLSQDFFLFNAIYYIILKILLVLTNETFVNYADSFFYIVAMYTIGTWRTAGHWHSSLDYRQRSVSASANMYNLHARIKLKRTWPLTRYIDVLKIFNIGKLYVQFLIAILCKLIGSVELRSEYKMLQLWKS